MYKQARKLLRRIRLGLLINRRIVTGRALRLPAEAGPAPVLELGGTLDEASALLDARYDELFAGFSPRDRVLVKINLNTADPYPASSDPQAVRMIVDLLCKHGISDIAVADCSSNSALPTKRIFQQTGVEQAVRGRVRCVCLERGRWASVDIHGAYMQRVLLSDFVYRFDKIVYLANLKTHPHAGYSAGVKLAMGFVHPRMRHAMHGGALCESIAELSLAVQPDVTVVDGRSAFVSGGPDKGIIAAGGALLASRSQMDVELAAYHLLIRMQKDSGCEGLPEDPMETAQFRHCNKLMEEGRL